MHLSLFSIVISFLCSVSLRPITSNMHMSKCMFCMELHEQKWVEGKTLETLIHSDRKESWTETRNKEKCCFGAARYILSLPLPSFSDRGIKLICNRDIKALTGSAFSAGPIGTRGFPASVFQQMRNWPYLRRYLFNGRTSKIFHRLQNVQFLWTYLSNKGLARQSRWCWIFFFAALAPNSLLTCSFDLEERGQLSVLAQPPGPLPPPPPFSVSEPYMPSPLPLGVPTQPFCH